MSKVPVKKNETWEVIRQLNYSEEKALKLYTTFNKKGYDTVEKLKKGIMNEDDLKKIGIKTGEKRKEILSIIKKENPELESSMNKMIIENAKIAPNFSKVEELSNIDLEENQTTNIQNVDNVKNLGNVLGRGAVSRLLYALTLVKKRLLEFNLKGSIQAEIKVAMFNYSVEIQFSTENRTLGISVENKNQPKVGLPLFVNNTLDEVKKIEEEVKNLRELEISASLCEQVQGSSKTLIEQSLPTNLHFEFPEELKDTGDSKEAIKNKQAKFSFLKKAVFKLLSIFRDNILLMAEKMVQRDLLGNISFGFTISLGTFGSITVNPKIDIMALLDWKKKLDLLPHQRQFGSLSLRLLSAKDLKKINCSIAFSIADETRESSIKNVVSPIWNEELDKLPCGINGEEIHIEIIRHKSYTFLGKKTNKIIGSKPIEEIFINVEKMKFVYNQPKVLDLPLITKGSIQVEFTLKKIDPNQFDGYLKIEAVEGKNLAKKDFTGKSDPFLIFMEGKIIANKINTKNPLLTKTNFISQSLNPVWNQTVTLKMFSQQSGFTIFCYDFDKVGDDDFMGKVFVPLENLNPNCLEEKWLDLSIMGKIRVKYVFIPRRKF